MLTRPGAPPDPAWMGNLSDSLCDPDRSSKFMMPFWASLQFYRAVGGRARRSEVLQPAATAPLRVSV